MQDLTHFKSLKKHKICKKLETLINANPNNNLANLNLFYTLNRENFIHILRNGDTKIAYSCSQSIAIAIEFFRF